MSENTPVVNARQATIAHIEQLNYKQLLDDQMVTNKFIALWNDIHGDKKGELMFAREKFNFLKCISESQQLQKASSLSLYGCLLDLAVNGLSLEKGSKPLCYLVTRNAKISLKGEPDRWETRASIEISPYGELVMRVRTGQIKVADNPTIVYEGDIIRVGLNAQGKKVVLAYEAKIPRDPSARIVGGFVRIERFDGSFEIVWKDVADTERLRQFSNKNNKGSDIEDKSNALYSSYNGQIDPGFFEAKIIKHAFAAYPKVRTGQFTQLATEKEEIIQIDYGINSLNDNAIPGTVSDQIKMMGYDPDKVYSQADIDSEKEINPEANSQILPTNESFLDEPEASEPSSEGVTVTNDNDLF